jgi:hypothetical protein
MRYVSLGACSSSERLRPTGGCANFYCSAEHSHQSAGADCNHSHRTLADGCSQADDGTDERASGLSSGWRTIT